MKNKLMLDITSDQKEKINKIVEDYSLKFVVIHGSYANGSPREGSDLDIAVLGHEPLSFKEEIKLIGRFGEVFGNNEEREIDLKSLHDKDPLFRYLVVKDGQLLYGNETEFNEFKAYAYKSFVDAKPLFDLQRRVLKQYFKPKV